MVIFIQSIGEWALVPEGAGRLVRPQSETSSGTWGHTAAQKGRQAFACPRPPWGSPWGYVSRSPGRLLAVTLGHLSCAQLTTQRGRVGWGGGGEQSDLTSSALPPPTTSASWGGRTSRLALRGFPGSACGHECPGVTDWRWMGAPSGPTCASVRVLPLPAFVPSPPDSPLLPGITPLEWHSFRLLSLSQGWP